MEPEAPNLRINFHFKTVKNSVNATKKTNSGDVKHYPTFAIIDKDVRKRSVSGTGDSKPRINFHIKSVNNPIIARLPETLFDLPPKRQQVNNRYKRMTIVTQGDQSPHRVSHLINQTRMTETLLTQNRW